MNTVSVDRKFLEHCLSVMRGVGELCQPIPRKSEDDPTEYCGGQALAELAVCYNKLLETIAYAEQVALTQAEQPEAGRIADQKKGLYRKYRVERLDGSSGPGGKHEHCDYFVLDLVHDKFAQPALRAYASACAAEYPALAADLMQKAGGEEPTNAEAGRDLAAHIAEAIKNRRPERIEIVAADLYRKALEEVIRDALKTFREKGENDDC